MKKVGLLFVLAMATVASVAQATAQAGTGDTDILGQGIFETDNGAFSMGGDTNVDQVKVGNDVAVSSGWIQTFPFFSEGPSLATNNLEIKKNQDSGPCACCQTDSSTPCKDCCLKSNIETIRAGSRTAVAVGWGVATNNVKIVTNQN